MFYVVYATCKTGCVICSWWKKNVPKDEPKEDCCGLLFPFPPSTPNPCICKEVLLCPWADSNMCKPAVNSQLVPLACRAQIHRCTNMVTQVCKTYTTIFLKKVFIKNLPWSSHCKPYPKKWSFLFCLLTFPNHHGISYARCHGFYTGVIANCNLAWDK